MSIAQSLGKMYRCPVCGAEVAIVSLKAGNFAPRCCNTAMLPLPRRGVFYRCPICGAMVMIIHAVRSSVFAPRCCNTDMLRRAA